MIVYRFDDVSRLDSSFGGGRPRKNPSNYKLAEGGAFSMNSQSAPIVVRGIRKATIRRKQQTFAAVVEHNSETFQELGANQSRVVLGRHQTFRTLRKCDRRILDRKSSNGEPISSAVSRLGGSSRGGSRVIEKFHCCGRQVVGVTERFIEVHVGVRAAVDQKVGGDGFDAGQSDSRVDELEAVLIETNGQRRLFWRRLVVARQVDGEKGALVVHSHEKVVEQARSDDAVPSVANTWFQRFQIDHNQVSVGEIHPGQADLDVSYNTDFDCVWEAIAGNCA